jgi:hypothetical protein
VSPRQRIVDSIQFCREGTTFAIQTESEPVYPGSFLGFVSGSFCLFFSRNPRRSPHSKALAPHTPPSARVRSGSFSGSFLGIFIDSKALLGFVFAFRAIPPGGGARPGALSSRKAQGNSTRKQHSRRLPDAFIMERQEVKTGRPTKRRRTKGNRQWSIVRGGIRCSRRLNSWHPPRLQGWCEGA